MEFSNGFEVSYSFNSLSNVSRTVSLIYVSVTKLAPSSFETFSGFSFRLFLNRKTITMTKIMANNKRAEIVIKMVFLSFIFLLEVLWLI